MTNNRQLYRMVLLAASELVVSAIACLISPSPAISQVAQPPSNPEFLFRDVPIPISQPCSAGGTRAYVRQLNLPSHLAINRIYYQRLVSECGALAVPALIEALKNPQENIRANAALAIGQIGTEANSAIPALIEALGDQSSLVQMNAAYALGQMGWLAEAALPALSDRLEDDNRGVIASAANAIGQIGSSLLNDRYGEIDRGVPERSGTRSVERLFKEGQARQDGLRLNLFAALYDAYNNLDTARKTNRAAWNRDANAQSASVSIIEAMDAVGVLDYVADVGSGSAQCKSEWCWLAGGPQMVAYMRSQMGQAPAVCRISPMRYVIPRCKTR